jgi:hypothetical protein
MSAEDHISLLTLLDEPVPYCPNELVDEGTPEDVFHLRLAGAIGEGFHEDIVKAPSTLPSDRIKAVSAGGQKQEGQKSRDCPRKNTPASHTEPSVHHISGLSPDRT